jgi:hypothetical protein
VKISEVPKLEEYVTMPEAGGDSGSDKADGTRARVRPSSAGVDQGDR